MGWSLRGNVETIIPVGSKVSINGKAFTVEASQYFDDDDKASVVELIVQAEAQQVRAELAGAKTFTVRAAHLANMLRCSGRLLLRGDLGFLGSTRYILQSQAVHNGNP